MGNPSFNVGTAVLNIFGSRHHLLLPVHGEGESNRTCYNASCLLGDLDRASLMIAPSVTANRRFQAKQTKEDRLPQDKPASGRHRALIGKLLDINRHLEGRLSALEGMHNKTLQDTSQAKIINKRRDQLKLPKTYQ
ncbi:hypothetical protein PHMEG_0003048 [Phytophthora megakarya]|uniref:Uncharacterized protein n=1 Tax=Phytophthora megakarya TaxID=4795 RepID=A0A225WZ01_9STRA|nr:hypothetical protein PHMEG_0003048 [Phytophthora megakarya]